MNKRSLKTIKLNNVEFDSLVDTGADVTLIRESSFNGKLAKSSALVKNWFKFFGLGNVPVKTIVNLKVDHEVVVVPDNVVTIILII